MSREFPLEENLLNVSAMSVLEEAFYKCIRGRETYSSSRPLSLMLRELLGWFIGRTFVMSDSLSVKPFLCHTTLSLLLSP